MMSFCRSIVFLFAVLTINQCKGIISTSSLPPPAVPTTPGPVASIPVAPELPNEHVCFGDIDVRNAMMNMEKMENCTVIEGNLQITLLNYDKAQQQKYGFHKLREITGYLVLYRVQYLRSMEFLFPNLATIRGKTLFFNYALVLFENPHLEDMGLYRLTRIVRGGIRIEKNPQLCHLQTIDWKLLSDSKEDRVINTNKDSRDCVDMCQKRCDVMEVEVEDGEKYKQPLCWNNNYCQKVCPKHCGLKPCYTMKDVDGSTRQQCCHQECLGGCTGPMATDCVACQNILYNGSCLPKCPNGLYSFHNRRCLKAEECRGYGQGHLPHQSYHQYKLLDDGQCALECPMGYIESKDDPHLCSKCKGVCPRVCEAPIVDNIQAAQRLYGCTVIKNSLVIQIRGGASMEAELEKNLGMIEEVAHNIKILRSNSLLSLRFLKNLRVIRGRSLHYGKFALYVLDNVNLVDLWDFTNHNLTIKNGTVSFHMNRMLCLDKIQNLVDHCKFENITGNIFDEKYISPQTNGNMNGCSRQMIDLSITTLQSTWVMVEWKLGDSSRGDIREYLGWTMYYREVGPNENISVYTERSICEPDEWETKDYTIAIDTDQTKWMDLLFPLLPFTRYAIYVQSYTITGTQMSATSPLVYFTTLPTTPSSVQNIVGVATNQKELSVTWDPPESPNGHVTHYYIYWRPLSLDTTQFDIRNYCEYKLKIPSKSKTTIVDEDKGKQSDVNATSLNVTSSGQKCCVCPKTKTEDDERSYQIQFENFLHDNMYRKKTSSLEKKSTRKRRSTDNLYHSEMALSSMAMAHHIKKRYSSELNQADYPSIDRESLTKTTPTSENTSIDLDSLTTTSSLSDSSKDIDKVGEYAKKNREYHQLLEGINGNLTEPGNETWKRMEIPDPYEVAIVHDRNDFIITNLQHFQMYSIEIIACHNRSSNRDPTDKDKLCSSRAISSVRTLPDPTADTLVESNITVVNGTEADKYQKWIHWTDPLNPNGVIVLYEIEIARPDFPHLKPETYCIRHKDFKEISGFKIKSFKPGNWSFRIKATSLAGNGSWTSMKYFTIEDVYVHTISASIIGSLVAVCSIIVVVIVFLVYLFYKRRLDAVMKETRLYVLSANPNYHLADCGYVEDEWEVPREKVEIGKVLGNGAFGFVYEGLLRDTVKDQPVVRCAIKTVQENKTIQDRINFLNEASVMKAFDCPHVVKLLGVVSKGQPTLVIMELMELGDLRNYLRSKRPDDSCDMKEVIPIEETLQILADIADGMAYLSHKKFVHRDLAARNCMVSASKIVKIGDFGLTRDIYVTQYYRKENKGYLPVRWMAPEALRDGVCTTKSDVWSYGVILFEIATGASQPYPGLSNIEVWNLVTKQRGVPERPAGCHPKLSYMMRRSWKYSPSERWSFEDILEYLKPDVSQEFLQRSYYFNIPQDGSAGSLTARPQADGEEMVPLYPTPPDSFPSDGDVLNEAPVMRVKPGVKPHSSDALDEERDQLLNSTYRDKTGDDTGSSSTWGKDRLRPLSSTSSSYEPSAQKVRDSDTGTISSMVAYMPAAMLRNPHSADRQTLDFDRRLDGGSVAPVAVLPQTIAADLNRVSSAQQSRNCKTSGDENTSLGYMPAKLPNGINVQNKTGLVNGLIGAHQAEKV